jgi:cell division protein FtsB
LSKDAATYWSKSRRSAKGRSTPAKNAATPRWFFFLIVISMLSMLCLAINLRAYSEMAEGSTQNSELNSQVEKLEVENLALQEEIHGLRNDAKAIEREARKIGMSRPNEKILVPTN